MKELLKFLLIFFVRDVFHNPLNHSTAILVLSCDKYADVWQPFFTFFKKYWKDCPFPVYLGTNDVIFKCDGVQQIFSHRKSTWSDELKVILDQIPEKNILLILEDYFIYQTVVNADIYKCLQVMEETQAAYLKLGAFPAKYDKLWPHRELSSHKGFAEIKAGSEYRVCLQTAIWNKEILLQLLQTNENPWQFEIEASKRSSGIKRPFLSVMSDPSKKIVHGPITYYCTALSAGKWMRGAVSLCKKENIAIDLTLRPVETVSEEFSRKIYIALPIRWRKYVDFMKYKLKLNK